MSGLDTRSGRASATQMIAPFLLSPVLPDGAIGWQGRQQTAHVYAGILATVATSISPVTLPTRGFALVLPARGFALDLPDRGFDLRLPS